MALGTTVLVVVLIGATTLLGGSEPSADRGGSPASRTATGPITSSPSTTTTRWTTTTATTTTTTTTGQFTVAPGNSAVVGAGKTYRYQVEVEAGTGVDAGTFGAAVERILGDRRGWTTADGISLQRVSDGPTDFSVRLATPATTDLLCLPLDTEGQVSCGRNTMAVINLTRWQEGAPPSKLSPPDYRSYVVTHEFGHLLGHLLGHQHVACPGRDQLAPTMMQQTYTIGDCAPNAWPVPDA